jgi:hypothetical protein
VALADAQLDLVAGGAAVAAKDPWPVFGEPLGAK